MFYFSLIGLGALAAQTAAQSSCNATAVVTVTPAALVDYDEIDDQVYYTTSSVTQYVLSPTVIATTAPSTAAQRRARDARQPKNGKAVCPDPTTTVTTTLSPSTTTSTYTVTYSEILRATQRPLACQASNNYGLFNGTLNINGRSQHQIPSIETTNDSCAEECCLACYTYPDNGCLSWAFDGAPAGNYIPGCALQVVTNGCPMYSVEAMLNPIGPSSGDRPVVAVGPCLIEVQEFIQGG